MNKCFRLWRLARNIEAMAFQLPRAIVVDTKNHGFVFAVTFACQVFYGAVRMFIVECES